MQRKLLVILIVILSFIVAACTNKSFLELTSKGFQYVFQNIPSDKEIAAQMCKYAQDMGYKNIVIYHEDSSYGENLADAFEKVAKLLA